MRKPHTDRLAHTETDQPQPQNEIDNRKRLTLLAAIEQIVETAEASRLSDDFFATARRPIAYLRRHLSLTPMQAVLLSLFVDRSDDSHITLNELAQILGCRKVHLLQYTEEMDALERLGYIRCQRTRKENITYRVPADVIQAVKENRAYTPPCRKNLSCGRLFYHIDDLFDRRDNHELTTEQLVDELKTLLEENRQLVFAQKALALQLTDDDFLLFLCFCHLYVENNDDNIGLHDFEDLYDLKWEAKAIKRALADGYSQLMKQKLVEYVNNNGFADRDSYKLTEATKQNFLSELGIHQTQTDNQKQLLQHDKLPAKTLYYNPREEKQVQRLGELLQPENLRSVQQRLKENGMRQGFACLFYGAPGTGKTETVYQLARLTGRNIMAVNIAEIKSMWVGESEKNIKGLFDRYHSYVESSEVAPILLFNEADALIGKRQEGAERAVEKMENSLQNIILQEMESLNGILIATTNLTQNMDKAFERRFLYKIEFCRPSVEAKCAIWQSMLPAIRPEEAHTLAAKYDFSGGQIENIARKQTVESILTGEPVGLETLEEFCRNELLAKPEERRKIGFR